MLLQIGMNGKPVPQRYGFEFSTGAAIQHLWNNEDFCRAMAEGQEHTNDTILGSPYGQSVDASCHGVLTLQRSGTSGAAYAIGAYPCARHCSDPVSKPMLQCCLSGAASGAAVYVRGLTVADRDRSSVRMQVPLV
jgi:hypothetical protein